jgi:hypothetical protein
MGLIEEASADALSILTEIGKDITVKIPPSGTPVALKCLVTQPMVLQDLDTGGFLNETTFEVKITRADYTAYTGLFAYGNIVRYADEDFRIVALANRPPSAWIIAKVQTLVQ